MKKYWLFILGHACLVSLAFGRNPRSWSWMWGDTTTFMTPDVKHYQGVTLEMGDRQFLTFRVRSCWDAHVYLVRSSSTFGSSTEIIIGGWKNGRSAIRLYPGTSRQRDALNLETPGILSCEEFRQFWVSWKNDTYLFVGRGPTFGQQVFISYNRNSSDYYHDINHVKFAAGWGAQATWQILDNSAEALWLRTLPTYGYQDLWKTTKYTNNFLTFELQACAECHIALSETVGVFRDNAYEIVIGGWGNTQSVIRMNLQGDNPPAVNKTKGLLNCNSYRAFWISWKDQTLMAGMGTEYNQNIIVKYVSPDPLRPINAVGITTGWNKTGDWYFLENKNNQYITKTPRISEAKVTYVTTPRQDQIFFNIKSCGGAQILLSPTAGPLGPLGATLVIGGDSNTRTYLRRYGANTDAVSINNYPQILDCQRWLPFWLTWSKSGKIQFGKYRIVGDNVVLTWQSNYLQVNSIGFNSPSAGSDFRIFGNQAEWIDIGTKNGNDKNFITVHQEFYKVFWVKACKEAKISLLPEDGVMSNMSYTVILGYDNNQFTAIIQPAIGGVQMISVSSQGILSCTETRSFWISWLDGVLQVGKGWTFGANLVVKMDQLIKYRVQSLNVETSDGIDGQWLFEEDRGDKIQLNTTNAEYQWFKYGGEPQWMFFHIMGCSDARIALAREYHNNPSSMYQIYIGHDSNTKTSILKGQTIQRTGDSDPILNCEQSMDIWVSWDNGNIRVGAGSIRGARQLVWWEDPDPHEVGSIGLASTAATVVQWKFYEMDMVESSVSLDPSLGFRQFWLNARYRQRLLFGVTACKGLHISLASILGFNDINYQYDVGILTTDDQKSFIKSGKRNEVQVQTDTPYVMNCNEERFLWLSWQSGIVIVGKGTTMGKNVIMTLHDLNALQVRAVGFMVEPGQNAKIRVLHNADLQIGNFSDMNRQLPLYGAMSGGEKAAAAIGFLALFALFGLAIYIILRPPEALKSLVTGQSSPPAAASPAGFKNPQYSASDTQPSA